MKEESHLKVLAIYGFVCVAISISASISKKVYQYYNNIHGPRARRFLQAADLLLYTAAWYSISVSLTLFNKWFYTLWMGGFDLPLSSTACHMVVKAILAQFFISNQCSPFQESYLELGFQERMLLVAPIGLATAADIVLSNFSFLYITVTFYTILKSASLLWILLWGLVFKLEKCSFKLSVVCVAVSVGLSLASWGETSVSLFGAVLVLLAGCMSGLRWALSQRLMCLYDELKDSPLHLVAKIAPWSAASSVLAAVLVDGKRLFHMALFGWSSNSASNTTTDVGGGGGEEGTSLLGGKALHEHHHDGLTLLGGALGFILLGGIASFLLLLVEVKLLQLTSSLTVGVLGTVKEILQIILAVLVFNDKLTITNSGGLVLCIAGTLGYQQLKSGQKHGASTDGDDGSYVIGQGFDSSQEYDPVRQADVELECFMNTEEEQEDYLSDGELSDGWDDMS